MTQLRLWERTPLSRRESAEGTAGTQLHHDTCCVQKTGREAETQVGRASEGQEPGNRWRHWERAKGGGAGELQEHQVGALRDDGAETGGKGWQEGGLNHGTSAARGKGASPTRLTTNKCYWVEMIGAFNNTSPSEGKRRARLLNSN